MWQSRGVHPCILKGIKRWRHANKKGKRGREQLRIDAERSLDESAINRHSVEYLVRFLRQPHSHPLTELVFSRVRLLQQPTPDGSLDVLCEFFANDTSLTKVALANCSFGSTQDTARILQSFQTNTSITHLEIKNNDPLVRRTVDESLNALLQSNTHLQDFQLRGIFDELSIRTIQSALQTSRSLKVLSFETCNIGDEGVCLIADALVGNISSVLDTLNLGTSVTINSLPSVSRLLESARLTEICFSVRDHVFDDINATINFVNALSSNKFLKTLGIDCFSSSRQAQTALIRIFQTLESNSTLQHLRLGRLGVHAHGIRGHGLVFHGFYDNQVIHQLIRSLPKMKGLKKLCWYGFDDYIQRVAFLSAFYKNASLEELPGIESLGNFAPNAILIMLSIMARNRYLAQIESLLTEPQGCDSTTSGQAIMLGPGSGIWHAALVKLAKGTQHTMPTTTDDQHPPQERTGRGAAARRRGNRFNLFAVVPRRRRRPDGIVVAQRRVIINTQQRRAAKRHTMTSTWTGASAIFKLLRERPDLLDKRQRRPPSKKEA